MAHRENWGSRAGFIMAAIGSAVGLGNIWRFPYTTYANGGGAFLIPYFVALFTAGIPIIILEMSIGQRYKTSPPSAFLKMSKKVSWIGWSMVFVAFSIAIYYAAIVAWSLNYTLFGFTGAWGDNTKDFFFNTFLQSSSGPFSFEGLVPNIAMYLVGIWLLIWVAMFSGIKRGIEAIVKVCMPILFFGIIILLVRVVSLDGASDGLEWLFKPDFSAIYSFKTWAAAYGQVFFSLSICFGIMISYASYLPDRADIANNATMTACINCGFSVLAAIVIFSVCGYSAKMQGIPLNEVAGGGIGLAFITIPTAVNLLPASKFVGPVFFFALFIAGFTSVISIVEVCCTTLIDKYQMKRKKAATILCILGCLISLLFATHSGISLIDIVDHYSNNFGILFGGIIEVIFISWFFGLDSFKEHVNRVSEFTVGRVWLFCLKYLLPVFLTIIGVGYLLQDLRTPYGGYSITANFVFGWLILIAYYVLGLLMQVIDNKRKEKKES